VISAILGDFQGVRRTKRRVGRQNALRASGAVPIRDVMFNPYFSSSTNKLRKILILLLKRGALTKYPI